MKVLSAKLIKEWDDHTILKTPIASIDLMERASQIVFEWIIKKYPDVAQKFVVFCGPGNNGGDGLVVSRLLIQNGYSVRTHLLYKTETISGDSKINFEKLQSLTNVAELKAKYSHESIAEDEIIIDAIFGTGISRTISGTYKKFISEINGNNNTVISIDVPSGLFLNQITNSTIVVQADYTLTFQCAKLGFLIPENNDYVGEFHILDIGLNPDFLKSARTNFYYLTAERIKPLIKKRSKFSHKGTFGHALLIAGSQGKIGAAHLSTLACLKTGVGLVTCHVPKCGYEIMQIGVPEAMISTDKNEYIFTSSIAIEDYSAIGVGPGLGRDLETEVALEKLFKNVTQPIVIDADAINLIAQSPQLKKQIPVNAILTPHIKEFERLAGKCENSFQRIEYIRTFCNRHKAYIVLKGAHSMIGTPEGKVYFNTTGNPGMATAGSGDVLTGIITSLLAQGYNEKEACLLGVYLHGFAGDHAMMSQGEVSLIARDIINNISSFFKIFQN